MIRYLHVIVHCIEGELNTAVRKNCICGKNLEILQFFVILLSYVRVAIFFDGYNAV
jgi:hypothetical protein